MFCPRCGNENPDDAQYCSQCGNSLPRLAGGGSTTIDQPAYPVQFTVDYPEAPLNRLTSFFRLITMIPIVVVVALVSGESGSETALSAGGILFLPPLLMILFRQKYPRWWFDWSLALLKFQNRVAAYVLLLRDEYPSTDEEQTVYLDIPYPDVQANLNRWLPLVKWILAIPHYIILVFLAIAMIVATIIAWFAILFTGRYPAGLFSFVVGVMRWGNRVFAYAFVLVTDRYPPFTLSP